MDAVSMLLDDHKQVKQWFREYDQAGGRMETKRDLAMRILTALEVHSKLEEEIFYPAVEQRARELGGIVEHSYEEHRVVDGMVEQLKGMNLEDQRYDQLMREMRQNVEHHMEEEESEMLPQAQRDLGSDEMDRLGNQMQQRRQQLMQQLRRAA
jgi:hemerythrin superfamily protein